MGTGTTTVTRQEGRARGDLRGASRKASLPDKGSSRADLLLREQLADLEAGARRQGPRRPPDPEDMAGYFGEDDARRERAEERKFKELMRAKRAIERLKRKLRKQGVAEDQLDWAVDLDMMRRIARPKVRAKIEARKKMLINRNRRTSAQMKRGHATRQANGRAVRDNRGRFVKGAGR
jgi:hypothetical protein